MPHEIARPEAKRYENFDEFYAYYLSEHTEHACRRMHLLGLALAGVFIAIAIARLKPWWLLAALLCGYGLPLIGHFAFERLALYWIRQPVYTIFATWRLRHNTAQCPLYPR